MLEEQVENDKTYRLNTAGFTSAVLSNATETKNLLYTCGVLTFGYSEAPVVPTGDRTTKQPGVSSAPVVPTGYVTNSQQGFAGGGGRINSKKRLKRRTKNKRRIKSQKGKK